MSRPIVYRRPQEDDLPALLAFLHAAGRARRVPDLDTLGRLIDGADRAILALDGDRVVGFGRALCDGVSNGYLSLVLVAADCRRQGIGRALVEHLTGADPGLTWVLRASSASRPFWQAMGFVPSSQAMERVRTRQP